MAGKKKFKDLGSSIGVRFERPIEELLESLAAQNDVDHTLAEVVRTLTTYWLMSAKNPSADYSAVAIAVSAWRKQYVRGLAGAPADDDAGDPKGKKRRRSGLE